MIDTVILDLPRARVKLKEGEQWDLISKMEYYSKYIKNPTKEQRELNYYPRLSGIYTKGKESVVKIEFSAPKIIYSNNLDELLDDDFENLLSLLQTRLREMGIIVLKKSLAEAGVSAVHYSKNIKIDSGYTTSHIISELSKVNLNKDSDLTKTRFMNSGETLQGYAISNSFVFYDKISDLKRSKKKSIDKEQTKCQTSLFNNLKKYEVLRFEVRLSQKRKLNSMFKKLGYPSNPTFKDVFSYTKSVRVLNFYWNEKIDKDRYVLFTQRESAESILRQILAYKPNIKPSKALSMLGLMLYAKDNENGLRALRAIFEKNSTDRTWYKTIGTLRELANATSKSNELDWYLEITRELRNYKPLRLEDIS